MTVDRVLVVLGRSTEPDDAPGGVAGWGVVRRAESQLGHGLARGAVSETLGVDLSRVRLGHTALGAPTVQEPAGAKVAVSISYGRGLVGCAVAVGRPVGLDIEREREIGQWGRVADAYLTDRERAHVAGSASPRLEVLRLLSRKEAVLKAAGIGIGVPLKSVDVLDDNVAPPGDPAAGKVWSVRTLEAAQGWLVGVAVGNSRMEVDVSWAREPQG